MNENDLRQLDELISRRIGTFAEDVQHKLDIVIEGQHGLCERMDRFEVRMDRLEDRVESLEVKVVALDYRIGSVEKSLTARINSVEENLTAKIDSVAADLSSHRRDTEGHGRGYLVSE